MKKVLLVGMLGILAACGGGGPASSPAMPVTAIVEPTPTDVPDQEPEPSVVLPTPSPTEPEPSPEPVAQSQFFKVYDSCMFSWEGVDIDGSTVDPYGKPILDPWFWQVEPYYDDTVNLSCYAVCPEDSEALDIDAIGTWNGKPHGSEQEFYSHGGFYTVHGEDPKILAVIETDGPDYLDQFEPSVDDPFDWQLQYVIDVTLTCSRTK